MNFLIYTVESHYGFPGTRSKMRLKQEILLCGIDIGIMFQSAESDI